jgi:hypothetical protein
VSLASPFCFFNARNVILPSRRQFVNVKLVEQQLLIQPERPSSPRFFVGSSFSILSFVCSVFWISVCIYFVLFILAIVSYVLLWITASDYPSGIFKLLLLEPWLKIDFLNVPLLDYCWILWYDKTTLIHFRKLLL